MSRSEVQISPTEKPSLKSSWVSRQTDNYILNSDLCVCSFFCHRKVIRLNILVMISSNVLLDKSLSSPAGGSTYIHNPAFVLWEEMAVWSCPSGILFIPECEPSLNPRWSKAMHSKTWNLSSNSVVLCLMQILSGVILEVLGEAFTEIMTAEVASAWTKLLANMCCGLAAVYKEAGWTELSSVEWRALVYRIRRFNREMNSVNGPFGRMQNIFWERGVKQCTRGLFWDYATKFTEKEREKG